MPPRPYYVIPKGGAFSFIEKAVKGVARAVVPGFSAVEGAVRGLKGNSGPQPQQGYIQGPTLQTSTGAIATLGMVKLPGFGPYAGAGAQGQGGTCPPGYHLDKATRSRCVRNRSTNFSNGKANRRAIGRLKGAERQAKKIFRVLGRQTGRVVPRTKGRKR